jgi:hypothetical protein
VTVAAHLDVEDAKSCIGTVESNTLDQSCHSFFLCFCLPFPFHDFRDYYRHDSFSGVSKLGERLFRTVPGIPNNPSGLAPEKISATGIHLFQKVIAKKRDFNRISKGYCVFFQPFFL